MSWIKLFITNWTVQSMIIKGETLLVIIKFKERIDFDKLFNNSDIA